MKRLNVFSKIISVIFIVGLLFTLVACGELEKDKGKAGENNFGLVYAVAYAESSRAGEPFYGNAHSNEDVSAGTMNAILMFHSKQELVGFCDENNRAFFGITVDKENNPFEYAHQKGEYESEFAQKMRSYDESFFKEKSLVWVYVFFPNQYPTRIENVSISEDCLFVTVARPEPDSYLDATTESVFMVEIDKKDIENKSAKLMIVKKGLAENYYNENK